MSQAHGAGLAAMKGEHCHENGVCHDHPDDGKDYG